MSGTPMFPQFPQFLHGGDYNPDQWLREPAVIDEDFRLFPLAGVNTVSLGIFAWAALEPEEGVFTLDWMEELIERHHQAGMKVILATPGGGKPNWMAQKYPEVRRVTAKGERQPQTGRHNHCPTSPIFREKTQTINRELSKRFGSHPGVLMWHINNEYNAGCHCNLCMDAFQRWLQNKYDSLDHLNDAWWSRFWSHTITDWGQITHIDSTVDGMVLDWKRFQTDQVVDFMNVEIEAVREFSSLPVTTNMVNFHYDSVDYRRFAPHLDIVSTDCYPDFHGRNEDLTIGAEQAFAHSGMRSLKNGQPWMLMEASPSAPHWREHYRLKRPGIHRQEMLQCLAHGADATLYFQWRKGRGSCEKWHGAVVDHEGSENTRVFKEVAEHGESLKKLQPILGSRTRAQAAMIYDWNHRWSLRTTSGPGTRPEASEHKYLETCLTHHRCCWKQGITLDILGNNDELSAYPLLILPMGHCVDHQLGAKLTAYVENGGCLIATYMTGLVDDSNRMHRGGFPGAGLRKVFGIWNEEMDHLYPDEVMPIVGNSAIVPERGEAEGICELIHSEGAEVMATYGAQFYQGGPAVTRNTFGAGSAWYLAARMSDEWLDSFYKSILIERDINSPLKSATPGVEITERYDNEGNRFIFALNFTQKPQTVALPKHTLECLETGVTYSGSLPLKPRQSVVTKTVEFGET